jgi:hypothetical protein
MPTLAGVVLPCPDPAADPGRVIDTGIVAVGDVAASTTTGPPTPVVDATGRAVIRPCCAPPPLLPGHAESLSLWDWLRFVDPLARR